MQIIPVLDIKGGVVVRGVMGDRANYRPIETPLSATPQPLDVARGLLSLAAFKALYIADLDAIEGRPANRGTIEALSAEFPELELWLDAGVHTADEARDYLGLGVIVVLGSETIDSAATIADLRREERAILSLDYRGSAFVGPEGLEDAADDWPARVIAMTLAKVGSGAGPDLERLTKVKAAAGGRRVFAAGGVRHAADLDELQAAGIAGALVATALHDGRLDAATLARYGT
ncbi:nickel transporter [Aureimonas sp. SA4125]|uniref:HisA/HisF-related TIM barrel protein n=1 Tax=Aureimonas sp. SA4125 TaxID=2826993 RepID=UPI001CC68C71|nr:HisA/HisF-related TIM barrel protein [Aureimonas sp. SA4125]BDA86315.1 nickel transporter [Aureimonas sp. SA4125]